MALVASGYRNLRPINTRMSMNEGNPDTIKTSLQSSLAKQQSDGNRLYRSITPEWFDDHQELIATFLDNPNNPEILQEIDQPHFSEGQASARFRPSEDAAPATNPFSAVEFPMIPGISQSRAESTGSPYQFSPMEDVQYCRGQETMMLSQSLPIPKAERDTDQNLNHVASSPGIRQIETPLKSVSRSSKLSAIQSRDPSPRIMSRHDSIAGTSSDSRRWSGDQKIISLAEKAASLGAPNKALSYKRGTTRSQTTQSADASQALSQISQSSEGIGELGEAAEGLSINTDEPENERRGPGRRKRTEWIQVETEEGETKWVSPVEYRKLRRRITNRISARKMRKKHAEEKDKINNIQAELEKQVNDQAAEMDELRQENEHIRASYQRVYEDLHQYRASYTHLQREYTRLQQYVETQQEAAYSMHRQNPPPHQTLQEAQIQYESGQQSMGQQQNLGRQISYQGEQQPLGRQPSYRAHHSREASFGPVLEAIGSMGRDYRTPGNFGYNTPQDATVYEGMDMQTENLVDVPQNFDPLSSQPADNGLSFPAQSLSMQVDPNMMQEPQLAFPASLEPQRHQASNPFHISNPYRGPQQ